MVENIFEFGCRLQAVPLFRIRLSANVLRPVIAVHFVLSRGLEQLDRLRAVTAREFKLGTNQRNPDTVQQRVLRKSLLHLVHQRLRGGSLSASRQRIRRMLQVQEVARE